LNGSNFVSIAVVKGKTSSEHEVQGISGGTITSVGVQSMIQDCLAPYIEYLKTFGSAVAPAPVSADTLTAEVSSL
jgi:Na+-transporting NADH:ubiquinone oxidoreductase subunit C